MGDPEGACFSIAVRVHPSQRDPITGESDISCHLQVRRLEFTGLEGQALAGLGGDPVRNVIFAHRGGANCWPTQKILVP